MIDFNNEVSIDYLIKNNPNLILNYYAKWCGPCKSIFSHLVELKRNFGPSIRIVNINVDDRPEIALELNIRAVPTLQYYKNGALYLKESGFRTKDHLHKNVDALLNITIIDIDKN